MPSTSSPSILKRFFLWVRKLVRQGPDVNKKQVAFRLLQSSASGRILYGGVLPKTVQIACHYLECSPLPWKERFESGHLVRTHRIRFWYQRFQDFGFPLHSDAPDRVIFEAAFNFAAPGFDENAMALIIMGNLYKVIISIASQEYIEEPIRIYTHRLLSAGFKREAAYWIEVIKAEQRFLQRRH